MKNEFDVFKKILQKQIEYSCASCIYWQPVMTITRDSSVFDPVMTKSDHPLQSLQIANL